MAEVTETVGPIPFFLDEKGIVQTTASAEEVRALFDEIPEPPLGKKLLHLIPAISSEAWNRRHPPADESSAETGNAALLLKVIQFAHEQDVEAHIFLGCWLDGSADANAEEWADWHKFRGASPLSPLSPAAGEPVAWRRRLADEGDWFDVTLDPTIRDVWQRISKNVVVGPLYASPSPTSAENAQVTPDVRELCERYRQLVKTGADLAAAELQGAPTSTFEIYVGHFRDIGKEIEAAISSLSEQLEEAKRLLFASAQYNPTEREGEAIMAEAAAIERAEAAEARIAALELERDKAVTRADKACEAHESLQFDAVGWKSRAEVAEAALAAVRVEP